DPLGMLLVKLDDLACGAAELEHGRRNRPRGRAHQHVELPAGDQAIAQKAFHVADDREVGEGMDAAAVKGENAEHSAPNASPVGFFASGWHPRISAPFSVTTMAF